MGLFYLEGIVDWKDKEQTKEYYRIYRVKNKAKIKKDKQNYYKENKEKIKKAVRKYARGNKEKLKIDKKNYNIKHKKRMYHLRRKWLKDNPWAVSYISAKSRCTNPNNTAYSRYGGRGIKFKLTMLEIKELWFRYKAYNMKTPSIDKINNDGNYEYANCQFMERVDNIKKLNKRVNYGNNKNIKN